MGYFGIDLTYKREYKNAEIELICEDDTLTTAKIYIGGEFFNSYEIGGENGLPNTKKNIESVFARLKAIVDEEFVKLLASIGATA